MSKHYFPLLCLLGFIIFLSAFTSNTKHTFQTLFINDTIAPFSIKAKDHKSKNVVSSDGLITLTSGLYNDFYQQDSNKRSGYLYIETRTARVVSNNGKRAPLNLSIVIDRSGSMTGDKIIAAKKGAKGIIDKLDSTDYVSVVVYDNFITVVQKAIPDTNKKLIKNKIDQIQPRGSTDLWGGTEKGYNEVLANYKPYFINRALLISDGLANEGITNPNVIRTKVKQYRDTGVSLSTFGVGLDYNEVLMTSMAETGGGNYYFIDTASKMAALFDKELNGLLNVAARNSELRVQLPPGIKIESVYPLKYEEKGSELVFKTGDLFSEDISGVLIKFSIPDKIKNPLVFSSSVTYKDIESGAQKTLKNENTLKSIRDLNTYLTHFNKEVAEQILLYIGNDYLEKAMIKADDGDYDRAKNYLDTNASFFKANSYYVNSSSDLKKMDSMNTSYSSRLFKVKNMRMDSVKMLQKTSRAAIYKIRNKKN